MPPGWAARRQPARSPLRHGEEAHHLSRPAHPPPVGVDVASSDVSNRFEKLLVDPTLLTLATQRGDLD